MASFDGFLVPVTQPSFSDALSSDAPIVDGFLVPTQTFSSSAQSFFLPAVPPPDIELPTIENISPVAGTGIESTQVITFDIVDETSLALVAVFASFADGTVEVIHDGDGFRGNYVGGSNSRSAISGGFSYSVLRIGGWPLTPTIEYLPIDAGGNLGVIA